jgi:hypothetical protein
MTKSAEYVDNLGDRKMVPDLSTMQSKETAPKDGRWFIAYCPDSPMCWGPFELAAWTDFTSYGVRRQYYCEQDTSEEIEFEGWWPLPIEQPAAGVSRRPETIKSLKQFLAEVVVFLRECSDDLEAYVEAEYAGTQEKYPSQKRRYDRDILPVLHAKQIIARYEEGKLD